MVPSKANSTSTLCIIHQRRQLTALCLMLSMALALVGAMRLTPMAVMTSPLLGALLFILHGVLDPSCQGFLHHRRIRFVGLALTVAVAGLVGLCAPQGATPALLFALAIAYRHHRGGTRLHLAAACELEELRQKILALESRRLLELQLNPEALTAYRGRPHPLSDKHGKAS